MSYEIVADRLKSVYIQKNQAYGDSFKKSLDKYGPVAALTRISDKFLRMEKIICARCTDVGDESLRDTVEDMANYCIMFASWLEEHSNV